MTVYENLTFALKIRKIPKYKLKDIVESTAKLLGLSDYLYKKPKQLSGGQRQRVALGRAISRKPALFLFDEPLSNLDAELRLRMRSEILSLHRRIEGTSLYVTHDQIEAMSLADRIMIINKGLQIGPEKPRLLYDHPPDTFTAEFLGNPGMNLLKCTTDENGNCLRIGNAQPFPHGEILPPNTEIIYGFRPEDCQIAQTGQIPVEVIGFEDTGKEYIAELSGPDNIKIFCLTEKKHSPGSRLHLKINKARFFNPETLKALTT
jgi:multiple sugar transport system ATP-binding protein